MEFSYPHDSPSIHHLLSSKKPFMINCVDPSLLGIPPNYNIHTLLRDIGHLPINKDDQTILDWFNNTSDLSYLKDFHINDEFHKLHSKHFFHSPDFLFPGKTKDLLTPYLKHRNLPTYYFL
jgi:hypothetical protein